MKTPTSRRQDGFTLVELLVVIAIIAVLAGAGFAAGNAAIQKAKKTTALATCTSLELAVNNFYNDNGSMPQNNLAADATVKTDDKAFLNVLLGSEGTTGTILNTRAVKYLSVKEGKNGKGGLIYIGTAVDKLVDPWGGYFFLELDGDYNEQITPKVSAGGTTKILNGRRVAAWSNGADAISGTGGKAGDDVTTW